MWRNHIRIKYFCHSRQSRGRPERVIGISVADDFSSDFEAQKDYAAPIHVHFSSMILKGFNMKEMHLALIEPPLIDKNTRNRALGKRRWQYHIEASCWLFLAMYRPDTDLLFCLEYSDSLRKHTVVIDKARVGYLRDSLMAGTVAIHGFGEFSEARLLLVGETSQTPITVKSLNFNVIRSEDLVKPRFRLVA